METLEKTLLTAGKWTLVIVPAGIALGALLGGRPEMKEPPTPWWQLTGREQVVSHEPAYVETGPAELNVFDGYRPDLDYAAEVWALPIPDYDLAALLEDPPRAPADDWPAVSYGADEAAESTADAAEAVAEEALAAEAPAELQPPPGEVRKSELALAGLY